MIKDKKYKTDTLNRAFDWLHNLKLSDEYKQLIYAWSLRAPEVWKRYELFEFEGHVEQKILAIAKKQLLKKWRTKRPRIFGGKK